MNGISSTLKEEIKKSQDSKKKEKFKFIAAIVITNLMVAVLCMPSNKEEQITPKQTIKTLHANHQMMVIPLQALVSNAHETNPETAVSLVSRDKKVISAKAYLHEEVKSSNEVTQFKIEISNADVVKVSQATESGVIAVPYVENKKINSIKRGSKYEVSL